MKKPSKRKMYIAGLMGNGGTVQPSTWELVVKKFKDAEMMLRAKGFEPVNPLDNGLPTDAPYLEHQLADLRMLAECDCAYFLSDWRQSRGATFEFYYCSIYNIEVFFENGSKMSQMR